MNNEAIAALLTPLLAVGLICGIVVYPFYRNWIIASKGYDADGFSKASICGVLSFGAFFLVSTNFFLGVGAFVALVVAGGLLRKEKVGLAHGLIITFMQGFSLPGRFLVAFVPYATAMLMRTEYQGRKSNANIAKARAWDTYQKNAANAETHGEVATAQRTYQETMSNITATHGPVAEED